MACAPNQNVTYIILGDENREQETGFQDVKVERGSKKILADESVGNAGISPPMMSTRFGNIFNHMVVVVDAVRGAFSIVAQPRPLRKNSEGGAVLGMAKDLLH